jgi:hypothetical protein
MCAPYAKFEEAAAKAVRHTPRGGPGRMAPAAPVRIISLRRSERRCKQP